ncbi:MAG: DUF4261 domain-containing protein [Lachnospiraceae bacterium]|nr:DUF4261 domain-containing protein [Lachnospiraceae bacterium]
MFFWKKKKEKKLPKQEVFQQELEEQAPPAGTVFMMHLLMKEKCEVPAQEKVIEVMRKHLGDVECFSYDGKMAGFAVKKHMVEFPDGKMPPQLWIMGCMEHKEDMIDAFTRSQMWDCKDSERILSECKYQVLAHDMLAAGLDYKDRANMLMDYMEALVELYPQCEAVFFQTSGKMFTAEAIRNHQIPRDHRFIYFAVNARFFNIQGTNDMMVDSLGMCTLFLPDVQYHFHGMEPDWVVNHAYNVLSYIYDNNCPIKSGETIDGIVDGRMSRELQWKCQYEMALIQPTREVLDICMGEYASGTRG